MFCVYDDNGKLLWHNVQRNFETDDLKVSYTEGHTSGSSKWMTVCILRKNKAMDQGITSIHAIKYL